MPNLSVKLFVKRQVYKAIILVRSSCGLAKRNLKPHEMLKNLHKENHFTETSRLS